jgi:hypothetical protein
MVEFKGSKGNLLKEGGNTAIEKQTSKIHIEIKYAMK